MICTKCKNKAIGRYSPDLDIEGIPFCEKHKKDVQLAYLILTLEGVEAFDAYIKEQMI